MLKLKSTLGLALIAGTLTALIGFILDVKAYTIFYRSLISSAIFGVGGYILGGMAESYVANVKAEVNPKGQNLDIISEGDIPVEEDAALDSNPSDKAQFSPFTPNNFERISGQQ